MKNLSLKYKMRTLKIKMQRLNLRQIKQGINLIDNYKMIL